MNFHPLAALAGLACPLAATLALADQVTLPPVHDATLYYSLTGDLANGVGEYLFTGNSGLAEPRRSLLKFDLSSIPSGSTIQQVSLKLTLTRSAALNATTVSVNRATRAWNEG